jgi:mRNA interferase MazF
MARVLRGDILWADLDPVSGHEQSGRRPVLVLSRDLFNERSGTVITVALTSQLPRAAFPFSVELVKTKLPKRTWAKTTQVRLLAVERLGPRLSRVHPNELTQIIEGLNQVIGDI